MSDTRPCGYVVAPLPDGWTGEGGDVTGPGWKSRNVLAWYDKVEMTAHPDVLNQQAPAASVVRALHDAGHLDAYRDRCEAAAWRAGSQPGPDDSPEAVTYLVVDAWGEWFRAWWDTRSDCFVDMRTNNRIDNVEFYRPAPKGPEVTP